MISKIVKYTLATVAILLVLFFIVGFYIGYVRYQSNADADAIRNIRLAYDDVDGTDLPSAPTEEEINASIGGPDKNNNTIRDDVELALFKLYPGKENEKIRAASLQYAQSEQIFLTKVYDMVTMKAAQEKASSANGCFGDIETPLTEKQRQSNKLINKILGEQMVRERVWMDKVETLALNNSERKKMKEDVYNDYAGSFESPKRGCDIIGL